MEENNFNLINNLKGSRVHYRRYMRKSTKTGFKMWYFIKELAIIVFSLDLSFH